MIRYDTYDAFVYTRINTFTYIYTGNTKWYTTGIYTYMTRYDAYDAYMYIYIYTYIYIYIYTGDTKW